QDFPKHRGKGYGEMGIIAHALAHSRLLKEATHVFKITGRYFVANAASLVRCVDEADPVPDIVCDLRENLTIADSRWFAGTLAFFREHLVPQREMIDDTVDIFFEHALARAVHSAMATGMGWRLPAASARLVGITATTNLPIAIGPGKRIRHRMKNWLFRY
nr:hypothetical protein [Planctomycetota bacterium]